MAYAKTTEVSVEKSRAEIERLVLRHRCTSFVTGVDLPTRKAMVQFKAHERIIRFVIELPDRNDKRFTQDPRATWRKRPVPAQERLYEQAQRSKWRSLLLVIKAKLEAVESNIATFEEEFMSHIVMPNDQTVAQIMTPIIDRAYASGRMPQRLLPEAVVPDEGEVIDAR